MDRIVERLGAADAYQTIAEHVPAFVFEARAGTMRRFLGALDDRWGGARSYFESNGASAEVLARWQALFVAAAPA